MLQIEHIYHFLFDQVFFGHVFSHFKNGVPDLNVKKENSMFTYVRTVDWTDLHRFFFYDQEPLVPHIADEYLHYIQHESISKPVLITSERSKYLEKLPIPQLYYFFHGFASLDWFRGYKLLNYNDPVVKKYTYDFQSFNRIISGDRSYRITFVSKLINKKLLDKGLVSFGVTDDDTTWKSEIEDPNTRISQESLEIAQRYMPTINDRLIIDNDQLSGDASASIPKALDRTIWQNDGVDYSAFWHVVTETVFYYDKLHLTEKIFKPIVSKQPFMLLAAPGNLAYLRSYGFKTFAGIIDESYDKIEDNDARIEAVVAQIKWYCDLTDSEKTEIQKQCEPIVEHNFHHFYGKFKEIITDELLDNTKKLFDEIGYDDSKVDYATVRKLLTS